MATWYHPKRILLVRPLEFWNTPIASCIDPEWKEQADKDGYYVNKGTFLHKESVYEHLIKNKMKKSDKQFKELIEAIVDEHFQITKKDHQNLNYLWHMYKRGTKAGDYKPFMLMAEMQLLKEMGYISAEEIQNMLAMIDSEDEDHFNLVWLAVRTWRLNRIKEHGVYSSTNFFPYMNIEKDYPSKVLNHEVFLRTSSNP
jgi:hypothetical protein